MTKYEHRATWLSRQDLPPLRWTVPGMFPEGCGLLIGAPKVGKSYLILGGLLAIARGDKVFGVVPVDSMAVFYMALEDGHRRMQRRIREQIGDGEWPRNFSYATADVPEDEVYDELAAWLEEHKGQPCVAAVDTLGKVEDDDSRSIKDVYKRDYRLIGKFQKLALDYPGCTILLIHHPRKEGKVKPADWMDMTSGSQGLNGAADFTAMLERKRGSDNGTLFVSGRDTEEDYKFSMLFQNHRWTRTSPEGVPMDVLTDMPAETQHSRVEAALRAAGEQGTYAQDIATELSIDVQTVRSYLSRLHEYGDAVRRKEGVKAHWWHSEHHI